MSLLFCDFIQSVYTHVYLVQNIIFRSLRLISVFYAPEGGLSLLPFLSLGERVSKHYETQETAAFINGILGAFVRGELPPERAAAKAEEEQ